MISCAFYLKVLKQNNLTSRPGKRSRNHTFFQNVFFSFIRRYTPFIWIETDEVLFYFLTPIPVDDSSVGNSKAWEKCFLSIPFLYIIHFLIKKDCWLDPARQAFSRLNRLFPCLIQYFWNRSFLINGLWSGWQDQNSPWSERFLNFNELLRYQHKLIPNSRLKASQYIDASGSKVFHSARSAASNRHLWPEPDTSSAPELHREIPAPGSRIAV